MPKAKQSGQSLDIAIANIEKQFGEGSIMLLDTQEVVDIETISTGSLSLDLALGVGGVPKGRIIEIYGPESSGKTTLSLSIVAEAQKQGSVAAFVDAEHALDPEYAKIIGVDPKKLLISQPDTGEQALDIVEMLVRSGAVEIIVVDSVAALVPRAEIEGEMGDTHVGLQARLMSQAMRKLAGVISKSDVCVIFINQIRMKIGVMFGCFHYDAMVLLADGTKEKIGKIVNQKIDTEVLSWSNDGGVESKKIIGWHDNGKADKFFNITVEYPHGNGRASLPIGDNHTVMTPEGEADANTLRVGDKLLIRDELYLSKRQMEIAVGTFLGDGSIKLSKSGRTASLRLAHSKKQEEYLDYKVSLLGSKFFNSNKYNTGNSGIGRDSIYAADIKWLEKYKRGSAIRCIDDAILQFLTPEAICLWYLDDGTFSGSYKYWGWGKSEIIASKLDEKSKQRFAEHCVKIGLPKPTITDRGFVFSGKKNRAFQHIISAYCPKCMEYKIHPKLRKTCPDIIGLDNDVRQAMFIAEITDISDRAADKQTHKFDITVEDNHCYFVDNILVHNSPETTSGGRALKFYSTIRLDIRKSGQIKVGEINVGNRTKVKVVKNKVAPPFRIGEFDLIFGEGISKEGELIDIGLEYCHVIKRGAWFSYKDGGDEIKLGHGRENARKFLRENLDVAEKLESTLRKELEI